MIRAAKQSQKVAAIDAAISASLNQPLRVDEVVAFSASDAMAHLTDIQRRCRDYGSDGLATFIAIRFLAIGLSAGLAVRDSAQLESM